MQNKEFHEALERKIYWLEKRIGMAQKDLWLFKSIIQVTNNGPVKKKVQQLELFTG